MNNIQRVFLFSFVFGCLLLSIFTFSYIHEMNAHIHDIGVNTHNLHTHMFQTHKLGVFLLFFSFLISFIFSIYIFNNFFDRLLSTMFVNAMAIYCLTLLQHINKFFTIENPYLFEVLVILISLLLLFFLYLDQKKLSLTTFLSFASFKSK
ncbi:MAG: Unknown protein [uncultured Campylobacterales bacterium]|uniref:Uncharacterized protein n=1 Tax=uncultured Campylobacterales bacterium TaxID=352960 RepID=A0A6S6SCG4_9BACT|nr:MAG: Unknown protein [uncultured Campylobacterales bacterium]